MVFEVTDVHVFFIQNWFLFASVNHLIVQMIFNIILDCEAIILGKYHQQERNFSLVSLSTTFHMFQFPKIASLG